MFYSFYIEKKSFFQTLTSIKCTVITVSKINAVYLSQGKRLGCVPSIIYSQSMGAAFEQVRSVIGKK